MDFSSLDRHDEEIDWDCNHAPCDRRLLGWIRSRFRVNPGNIWHRLDVEAFCDCTCLSERTVRYAITKIRDDADEHGLKFRTVFKHDLGKKGAWTILVANDNELLFDKEPLFYSDEEKSRHIRPMLTESEIEPEKRPSCFASKASEEVGEGKDTTQKTAVEGTTEEQAQNPPCSDSKSGSPCNGYLRRDSFRISAVKNKHRPPPDSRESPRKFQHRWETQPITPEGEKKLRAKAGAITRRIGDLFWENCKVTSPNDSPAARTGISGFVFKHLRKGFQEKRIIQAFDTALHRLHGTATDRDEIFNVSSTIKRATDILAKDDRSTQERATEFYQKRYEAHREFMEQCGGSVFK